MSFDCPLAKLKQTLIEKEALIKALETYMVLADKKIQELEK